MPDWEPQQPRGPLELTAMLCLVLWPNGVFTVLEHRSYTYVFIMSSMQGMSLDNYVTRGHVDIHVRFALIRVLRILIKQSSWA